MSARDPRWLSQKQVQGAGVCECRFSLVFRKACPGAGGGDQGEDGGPGRQPRDHNRRDEAKTDSRRGCGSAGLSVHRAPVIFTSGSSLQMMG